MIFYDIICQFNNTIKNKSTSDEDRTLNMEHLWKTQNYLATRFDNLKLQFAN